MNVRNCGILLVLCAMLVGGCASTPKNANVQAPVDGRPLWAYNLGQWIRNFDKENADMAGKRIWVTGISEPVRSRRNISLAQRSAADRGLDNFVLALGVDVRTFTSEDNIWSNETADLVEGIWKESLKMQMADHNVNLQNEQWYEQDVDQHSPVDSAFLAYGLFYLDTTRLNNKLISDTLKDFEEKVEARVKEEKSVRQELVNRAKQASQERLGVMQGTAAE